MHFFDAILETLDIDDIKTNLTTYGWSILPKLLPNKIVKEIKSNIDQLSRKPETEVNFAGSEHRIWKAHKKSKYVNQFQIFSDKVISELEKKERSAFDVLAIRNKTISTKKEDLKKGRWHLDSFRGQLKIFVFLTNVTENTGAFEMIPKTHKKYFKIIEALSGNIFSPFDFLRGTRSYASFNDDYIEKLLKKGYPSKIFEVEAGTIAIVDTSCMHRARPCINGSRYALTSYYS